MPNYRATPPGTYVRQDDGQLVFLDPGEPVPAYVTGSQLAELLAAGRVVDDPLVTPPAPGPGSGSGTSGAEFTWTTAKTAAYTAVSGDAVPVTGVGAGADFAVTLPASPVTGDRVRVARTDNVNNSRVITITGTGIADTISQTEVRTYVYTGTVWARDVSPTPGLLMPAVGYSPATGNAATALDVLGLFPRSQALRPPAGRKLLTLFDTLASLSASSGATADTDPGTGTGSLTLTASANATTYFAAKTFPAAVNLTDHVIRAHVRYRMNGGSRSDISANSRILLTSDPGGSFTNHIYFALTANGDASLTPSIWDNVGSHISQFTATGTGANIAAITAARIQFVKNAGVTQFLDIRMVDAYPVTATKAKMVLHFDDSLASAYSVAAPRLALAGFPAVMAANIAEAGALSTQQLRDLQDVYGWQVITHAYSNTEHNVAQTGDAFVQGLMKSRHLQMASGLTGGQDFAYYGNNGPSAERIRAVRSHMRTGRHFLNQVRIADSLPPMNPAKVFAYGYVTADDTSTATMQAYVDKVIATKGLGQIVYHNVPTIPASLEWLVTYLDANRATIDTVTLDEALAPYSIAA